MLAVAKSWKSNAAKRLSLIAALLRQYGDFSGARGSPNFAAIYADDFDRIWRMIVHFLAPIADLQDVSVFCSLRNAKWLLSPSGVEWRAPVRDGGLQCFARTGVYAPLLARTRNRNANGRPLGHDVRCWKRCKKGRYRQHRAQSRGPTLLKLHRPFSGALLRFSDYSFSWQRAILSECPTIRTVIDSGC